MGTAVLEPTTDTADAIQVTEVKDHVAEIPEFVTRIHQDYLAQVAHTFIVSGNVFDYMDPQGSRMFILDVLAAQFDTAVKRNNAAFARKLGHNVSVKDKKNQVLAFFEAGKGLTFMTKASKDAWVAFMNSAYNEEVRLAQAIQLEPIDFGDVMTTLNWYFKASKERMIHNKALVQEAISTGENPNSVMLDEEINLSIVFMDAPFNVPNGDLCHMESDRGYMAMIRAWSRDLELGNRNKIIFVTGSLQDMNEVLRSGDAFINCVTVKKPNLTERETWLNRYDDNLRSLAQRAETAQKINGKVWRNVVLAEGETLKDIAIQAAGLNFKQMEGPIVSSATRGEPLSRTFIRKVKQELLEKEYGGVLEFIEPEYGFEIIGGHEHLIRYARERIITPLRQRRKEICSRGLLLTGPPGTGKTQWATALAKEADMSFVLLHMDKLKDSLVGGSEKLMRKLLEALRAAAPCIAFMDEIDSVYGPNAREGARDGGVQSGQFNEFMKFASDPSRVGEIVLIAATNRPDMLDAALVRPGRFDDILPALPPRVGDWKGRMAILFAIMNHKKAKFTPDMQFDIEKGPDPMKGLGPFAFDKRMWTGAEINKLVEDAILNASLYEDDRRTQLGDKYLFRVTADDWAAAYHNVLPKTGNVQGMINCALYFMNNLRYCPVGWQKEATNRKDLAKTLKEAYPTSAAQFDRE